MFLRRGLCIQKQLYSSLGRSEALPFQHLKPTITSDAQKRAEETVESILKKYVQFDDEKDWKILDFTYIPLKFKVVRDCMAETGLRISNIDLTNIVDTASLVECLTGKWQIEKEYGTLNSFDLRDPVKLTFEVRKQDYPDNVYFVESQDQTESRRIAQELAKERDAISEHWV